MIDPNLLWERQGGWRFADEALRVGEVGGIEDGLALLEDRGRLAEVDPGGREHANAGVAMVVVVPGEETVAEGVAVLGAAEAVGKSGRYFMVRK